jgi:hypothetical protein
MQEHIDKLYELIEKLRTKCSDCFDLGSWRNITLENIDGHHRFWKKCKKGVYLFFDRSEKRSDGLTYRIVRVGTHDVKSGASNSTLWGRLRYHKGTLDGGGNHRASIFRLLVGVALINRNNLNGPVTWGIGSTSSEEICAGESGHEEKVSKYIWKLPFLVLKLDKKEDRQFLEHCLISLLSNINRRNATPPCPDEPSENWLGRHSCRPLVKNSGLWNNRHADKPCNPECVAKCLKLFEQYVDTMCRQTCRGQSGRP